LGTHVFGCDLCQDVCPWNRRAPVTADDDFQPRHAAPSLAEWAALTADEFRERFRATPLWRTKHQGLLRNIALAMGNERNARYRPLLSALAQHDDAGVRQAAAWAMNRLEGDNQGQ
jgi:epoxyqueuosine reductase